MMHPPTRPRPAARRLLFALGCALFALLGTHGPAGAAPPPISFVEPTVVPTPASATDFYRNFTGVAKGDFNGDGHLDFAATYADHSNYNAYGQIEIALGNGDGTFGTPAVIKIPQTASGGEVDGSAILAKDFNGDGHLDLVVTTSNSTVLIFPGYGDGTFAAPTSFALPASANSLQAGDLNGDGKLDLVALIPSTNQVAVLMGNGNGTFAAPVLYTVDANASDMALANVDGKNGLDIVVAAGVVDCLLNSGNGTFAAKRTSVAGNKDLLSLYVADFDGDGKPDVVAAGSGQVADQGGYHGTSFVFLKGVGDGTFLSPATTNDFSVNGDNPTRFYTENVTPDLNGDGHPDVVFASEFSNTLTVGYGDGKGNFSLSFVAGSGGSGLPNTNVEAATPFGFVFGSFTGQPLPDILVASQGDNDGPGGLSLVRANPAKPGAFLSAYLYSTGDANQYVGGLNDLSFALGDFLHNGTVSLAALGNENDGHGLYFKGVDVVPGNGDGTFAPELPYPLKPIMSSANYPSGADNYDLASADFNGDGLPDLIYNTAAGYNDSPLPFETLTFGEGNGQFGNGSSVSTNFTGGNPANAPIQIAPFGGPGRLGFAVQENENGSSHVFVYLYGTGGANTFTQTADLAPGQINDLSSFAAGDFDGDGKADLIIHTYNPERLWFYKGNGDGTFQAPAASSPGIQRLFCSATADLNGDGKLDLIFGTDNSIMVLPGNGDGTFGQPAYYPVPGGSANGLAVADFNGDGHPDVAVAGAVDAVVLPGVGDGTFGPAQRFATGFHGGTAFVHTADLNGDGRPDLVYSTGGEGDGNIHFSVLLAAVPSAHTHLLWNNADGKAAFWDVDGQGNLMGLVTYGPFTDGGQNVWHATSMATGPDGVSHVVWNNPDGKVALWTVQTNGSVTSTTGFGPYADGSSLWQATGVSVGPDGMIHLLWTNPDRKAAFWNVTPSGSVTGVTGYGPYFDGSNPWIAIGVSTGPDNVSHLVWANTDGHGAFWDLGADGSIASVTGYGPYTDGSASNLWYSQGVSTGPDNVSHLLWNNVDAKSAFWSLNNAGAVSSVSGYGPYADGSSLWRATALATGPDDASHLLWNNPDGKAALWLLGPTGGIATVTGYGPYTDGSPSTPWNAVAVSVGP